MADKKGVTICNTILKEKKMKEEFKKIKKEVIEVWLVTISDGGMSEEVIVEKGCVGMFEHWR